MCQITVTRSQRSLVIVLELLICFTPLIGGFSWGGDRKSDMPFGLTATKRPSSALPDIYTIALNELQELESEPLCHRIAARLLVNNCQVLAGKDEATVLIDSGRQVRDFVDSYAASLAICDLERGRFTIPSQCAKFRESALGLLSPSSEAHLHVTSREIDQCLSALATSDSAWSTWVSYRHKALRFCEAARADNEKDQSILLYQRLTKVISKLADGVDAELQKRMTDIEHRARQAADNLGRLDPRIDQLHTALTSIETHLSREIEHAAMKGSEAIKKSLESATGLKELLVAMIQMAHDGNSQIRVAHEQSVDLVTRKANDEMGAFVAIVASAVASSAALQNQIEMSRLHAAELEARQDYLEKGMAKVIQTSQALSSTMATQSYLLRQAGNITEDILDSLDEAASAASRVGDALFRNSKSNSWWPYLICPTASLIMGSYGLPPSAMRNVGLIALGEVVGHLIASFEHIHTRFSALTAKTGANTTLATY